MGAPTYPPSPTASELGPDPSPPPPKKPGLFSCFSKPKAAAPAASHKAPTSPRAKRKHEEASARRPRGSPRFENAVRRARERAYARCARAGVVLNIPERSCLRTRAMSGARDGPSRAIVQYAAQAIEAEQAKLRKQFQRIDTDGSGKVDKSPRPRGTRGGTPRRRGEPVSARREARLG